MKNLIYLMLLALCLTSCGTTAVVYNPDDIYTGNYTSIYYDDALYEGYEIVWVSGWPYWHRDHHFVPYHHHHTLGYVPNHWSYRTYKPVLRHNHYKHKYQPDYKDKYHNGYYSRPHTARRDIRKPIGNNSGNIGNPVHRPDNRGIGSNLHNRDNNQPRPNAGNQRFNQSTRNATPSRPNHSSQNNTKSGSQTGKGYGGRR